MRDKAPQNEYSMGLALMDLVPVIFFGASTAAFLRNGCSILAALGLILVFTGGICKALWKLRIASGKEEVPALNTAFHRLMPAGGLLLTAEVIRWIIAGSWHGFFSGTRWIWILLFFAGMIVMGFLKSRQGQGNHMVWCAEITNSVSQLMLFLYAICRG